MAAEAAEEAAEFHTLVLTPGSNNVGISMRGGMITYVVDQAPYRTPFDFGMATGPAGHTVENTAPIVFLTEGERLPNEVIAMLPQGPREVFAVQANLRYQTVASCSQPTDTLA